MLEDGEELKLDIGKELTDEVPKEEGKKKRKQKKSVEEEKKSAEELALFMKDYYKMGGIQHIICSATMTIDNLGRITPKREKMMKKLKNKNLLKE